MKKTKLLLVASLSTISLLVAVVTSGAVEKGIVGFVNGQMNETIIKLTSDQNPAIDGNGNGTINVGSFTTINYTNASNLTNYHVVLGNGGRIIKTSASKSLNSFVATFEGDLTLDYAMDENFKISHFRKTLTSGSEVNIDGNYWTLTSVGETKITSIVYKYGCYEEASAYDADSTSVLNVTDTADYVDVVREFGVSYYTIKFDYDNTNGLLDPNTIKIKGDSNNELLTCDHFVYLSDSKCIAYFDITNNENTLLNGKDICLFFTHLSINGSSFSDVTLPNRYVAEKTIALNDTDTLTLDIYPMSSGRCMPRFIISKGGFNTYKFEAEDAAIETTISNLRLDYEGKTAEKTKNPSGSGFISGANGNGALKLTFHVYSDKECQAVIGGSYGRREYAVNPKNMFNYTINGTQVTVKNNVVPVYENTDYQFYDWYETNLGIVNLIEGENFIVLEKPTETGLSMLNFDYLTLKTSAILDLNLDMYTFNSMDAKNPSIENNECNPFSEINGGSHSDSDGDTYKGEVSGDKTYYKYGGGNNSSVTATVIAEKDSYAELYLYSDVRPGKTFTAINANDANPHVKDVLINDSTEGFTYSLKKYPSTSWFDLRPLMIGQFHLKAGVNTIAFSITGDNVNYSGMAIAARTKVRLNKTFFEFNTNNSLNKSTEINDCNPFVSANGGSRVDSDGIYGAETAGVYKYGAGNGAVLTVTLNAEKAGTVKFGLINDCRPGRTFSYNQVAASNPFISYLKVNNSTDGVSPSSESYVSQGWNEMMYCELATITLVEGSNTIEFKIGGDNINYCGVFAISDFVVSLPVVA